MSYLSSQSGPQSLEMAAAAQQTRWTAASSGEVHAASALSLSPKTSQQAPGGPGGLVRKFSTGYDLWADSPLGADLYRESVSPLATKIIAQEEKMGINPLGGTHPDYVHYTNEPLFQTNVGPKRKTNFPGPLYRADKQTLETDLDQENQGRWDELDIPQATSLPESYESTELYEHKPIDNFISQVTDFISRKPAMSALILLGVYIALK